MSTTTEEALSHHVDFVVNELLSISEGTYEFDTEFSDNALEAWLEAQLSVEFIGKCTFSQPWEVTSVEVVSTTGGPHVEVVWDRSALTLRVNGYWGGRKVSRAAECPELEAHLEEMADLVSHA